MINLNWPATIYARGLHSFRAIVGLPQWLGSNTGLDVVTQVPRPASEAANPTVGAFSEQARLPAKHARRCSHQSQACITHGPHARLHSKLRIRMSTRRWSRTCEGTSFAWRPNALHNGHGAVVGATERKSWTLYRNAAAACPLAHTRWQTLLLCPTVFELLVCRLPHAGGVCRMECCGSSTRHVQ